MVVELPTREELAQLERLTTVPSTTSAYVPIEPLRKLLNLKDALAEALREIKAQLFHATCCDWWNDGPCTCSAKEWLGKADALLALVGKA